MALRSFEELFKNAIFLLLRANVILASLLCFGLLAPAVAQELAQEVAEERFIPEAIRPFADASFVYETNFFRTEDDAEALASTGSDNQAVSYQQLSAGVDTDIEFGLQKFVLRSEVYRQIFNRFSELNHTGFDVRPSLDWQIGDVCAGELGYRIDRRLTEFTELQAVIPNLRTRHNAFLTPTCWVAPRWQVRGEVSGYLSRNDETPREFLDRDEITGLLGADFVSRAGNRAGLEAEVTRGDYPNRDAARTAQLDDGFTQVRSAGVAGWSYRDWLVLDGRLGFVHRDYENGNQPDFYEAEGRVDAQYFVAEKITLTGGVFRELVPVESTDANTKLNTGVEAGVAWDPTEKIKLSAGLEYRHQDFSPEDSPRDDNVVSADLKVSYDPIRPVSIYAGFSARERWSDKANADFSAQIFTVGGRITF